MGLVGENMDIKFHMLQDITNKFGIDRVIGSGGYGIVYKVYLIIYLQRNNPILAPLLMHLY